MSRRFPRALWALVFATTPLAAPAALAMSQDELQSYCDTVNEELRVARESLPMRMDSATYLDELKAAPDVDAGVCLVRIEHVVKTDDYAKVLLSSARDKGEPVTLDDIRDFMGTSSFKVSVGQDVARRFGQLRFAQKALSGPQGDHAKLQFVYRFEPTEYLSSEVIEFSVDKTNFKKG